MECISQCSPVNRTDRMCVCIRVYERERGREELIEELAQVFVEADTSEICRAA